MMETTHLFGLGLVFWVVIAAVLFSGVAGFVLVARWMERRAHRQRREERSRERLAH